MWLYKECRSPCGERGLKSSFRRVARLDLGSLPVRGAWVEIAMRESGCCLAVRRSPCGERGLKFALAVKLRHTEQSLPVRGAWVEIASFAPRSYSRSVAPRAGSVG